MYEMFERNILAGGYDLQYMLGQIDQFWLERAIDATERDALKALAREHAAPEDSYAPVGERLLLLESAVRELTARVAALEASDADKPDAPTDEWPEWVQPTGAMDVYAKGDKVTFNGRRWVSTMDANAWSPAAYPQGWEEYKDAKEED